jgi:hypothetical protein
VIIAKAQIFLHERVIFHSGPCKLVPPWWILGVFQSAGQGCSYCRCLAMKANFLVLANLGLRLSVIEEPKEPCVLLNLKREETVFDLKSPEKPRI